MITEYIKEQLKVTQGQGRGERFRVWPWERRFLQGAFRAEGDAAISVSRANGKSTLCAGIACGTVDGPLREPRADTVVVAGSFEQARIIFNHCQAFLAHKLEDKRTWRGLDSTQSAMIEHRPTGARIICRGSDPGRLHGLSPKLALIDEPARIPVSKRDAILSALRTAAGKVPGSRLIALGTRSSDPTHWFSRMLEPGGCSFAQVHAAGPDDPPFRKSTWIKANPSLPYFPELERRIRIEAEQAKRDPSLLQQFLSLRLNQGVSDVLEATLLAADTWARIEGRPAGREGAYILGLDIGAEAAMTAAAGYWPETGRLEAFGVFPEKPDLRERGLKDGVGSLYADMAKRQELLTAGEYAPDLDAMLAEVLRRWGRPAVIVADRWKEAELRNALSRAKFPMAGLVTRGMGYLDGAADVRAFRKACLTDRVFPETSLLLRSAVGEARVSTDPAGNQKLSKGTEGGRRLRARDDAACAAILAVAEGERRRAMPKPAEPQIRIIKAS